MPLSTPVAFFIFNRPETTARVFEEIRRAEPKQLLIVADGPRADRPGEDQKCAAARRITERIEWPCEVVRNFSDVNLGCRNRLSSGLDWVFSTVEEAIILEDDCLPDPSFFLFCLVLLTHYRGDEGIMMISGDDLQFGRRHTSYSYYYSRYAYIWGWASWRRAWRHYDVHMNRWPKMRESGWLDNVLDDARSVRYWTSIFDRVWRGEIDTWDFQWTFACWMQKGLSVMPHVNLVSNIGFASGLEATHTVTSGPYARMSRHGLSLPLRHPLVIERDRDADVYMQRTFYDPSLLLRGVRRLGKMMGRYN
jgi:hypothetical protein